MSKIVRMIKNMSKVQKIVALAVSTVVVCGAVVGGVLWYSHYSEEAQMKAETEQIIADAEEMDSEELSEFLDNNAVDEETRKTLEEKLDEKYTKEDETVATKPDEDKKEESSNYNSNGNSNSNTSDSKPNTDGNSNTDSKPSTGGSSNNGGSSSNGGSITKPSKPSKPSEPSKPENPPVEKPQRTWQYMSAMSNELFGLINNYRVKNGVDAVRYDADIQAKAKARAEFNAKNQRGDHDIAQISILTGRDSTPQQFLQRWIDSPSHRDYMLNSLLTRGGVAIYKDSDDIYYIVAGLDMDF
ncbi:MAG: CAP domain-containing protein [Clostridium paraputrificum]